MGMSGVSYDSRPGQKRGGKYLKEGAFRRLKIKKTVSWGSTEQYNLRLWRLCKSKALGQCSGRGSKNPITLVVGVSSFLEPNFCLLSTYCSRNEKSGNLEIGRFLRANPGLFRPGYFHVRY